MNMTKGDCENLTVESSEKFAIEKGFISKYTLVNPPMFHQNIFSALLMKCRLNALAMCSLLRVQPIGLESNKQLELPGP